MNKNGQGQDYINQICKVNYVRNDVIPDLKNIMFIKLIHLYLFISKNNI
jgi:hypothetical protein